MLPNGSRVNSTWALSTTDRLAERWYRNKTADAVPLALPSNSAAVVPARGFVRAAPNMSITEPAFERATLKDIAAIHSDLVAKHVAANLPKCIFWKYADQYLLPSSIDVASFCATPDTCIPLKSMFELAGYEAATLAATLTQAQAQGHHRYVQILEKTANKASEHIRQVWKDYKSVRVRLESHGATLSPVIVDEVVPLDMANRSDGFKRFVSFLLQVSAKVRTEELKDTLILIDEPEIALHPSGARNLMRELIEIGKSNTVVYSTHSIFMIDKNVIGRHLVVEKKKEVTTTKRCCSARWVTRSLKRSKSTTSFLKDGVTRSSSELLQMLWAKQTHASGRG
jgi:AAA ATPase domain